MAERNVPEQIQNYISGATWPADKGELVNAARMNRAPHDVLEALREMPERRYERPNDVQEVLRERTGGAQTGAKHARREEGGERPGQGHRSREETP